MKGPKCPKCGSCMLKYLGTNEDSLMEEIFECKACGHMFVHIDPTHT